MVEEREKNLESNAVLESQSKYLFSKDEIAQRAVVPKIVENDLKNVIEERLQQCGLYYRVFSRIKTASSLEHKYQIKSYNDEKKIQDLVGLRIDLYFEDDLPICQDLMQRSFDLIGWSSSESKEEEFKATKINGVFRLPEYLKAKISSDTWEMGIDDTFEIQLKTMFFEGWHEIEHDMRYKQEDVWENRVSFSRYFNSILATLELCDKSMVTLFEDMGHSFYKEGLWAEMIRVHFRLKMGDQQLYPDVKEFLNKDYKANTDNIAKRLFKCSRARLIEILSRKAYRIPINPNTIIALLNDGIFRNEELRDILKNHDVYNDGRIESRATSRNYELKKLPVHTVFQSKVELDCSKLGVQETFEKASAYAFYWMREKYLDVLGYIPEQPSTFYGEQVGYRVGFLYEQSSHSMRMRVTHVDLEIAGRVWLTKCKVYEKEGRLFFNVVNSYVEPEQQFEKEQGLYFSYPRFYREIVDNIGAIDGVKLTSGRKIVRDSQVAGLQRLIETPDRQFPVVLVVSNEAEDGMMDEEWLGRFRVSDFKKSVWRYVHVYTGYSDSCKSLLESFAIPDLQLPGLYIFWPKATALGFGESVSVYSAVDVKNCSFGRHREKSKDVRTYDIVKGGQGFYHMLLRDLRNHNVMQDISEDETALSEAYRSGTNMNQLPESNEEWMEMLSAYNAYNEELISENELLTEKVEQLEKELFRLKKDKHISG